MSVPGSNLMRSAPRAAVSAGKECPRVSPAVAFQNGKTSGTSTTLVMRQTNVKGTPMRRKSVKR